jgi:release factor glutamine methyltransferase
MTTDPAREERSATAALTEAAARLQGISDTPRLDAEMLLAHALGIDRNALLPRLRDLSAPSGFDALVDRRAGHEPVAYIRGEQEFWDIRLMVTPDVLIPRGDSETLIEAARDHFAARTPPAHILDMGTGSGALLLAALSLFGEAHGTAIDASAAALCVASDNAGALGMAGRSRFLQRSWRDGGWAQDLGTFDLILCNPPYVETTAELAPQVRDFEPTSALFAGTDGLEEYAIIMPQIDALLKRDGIAIFEIGRGQDEAVRRMATAAGFFVQEHRDLGGIIRALQLQRPASP